MSHKTVIAAFGGDARQKFAIEELKKTYDVRVWGMGEETEGEGGDWKSLLNGAEILLLPMPASLDGVRVYSPLQASDRTLRLTSLLNAFEGRLVLGGRLPEALYGTAEKKGLNCVDYLNSEILQLKNAMPTAEGALCLAMQSLPVTLDGCETAVVGYGRIGELLAQKLAALGASVSVLARRRESLTRAELQHHRSILLHCKDSYAGFEALPKETRVLFNTVPVRILTQDVLGRLPRGCLLVDLASSPGGIDFDAARKMGFEAIWGTALPGKYAPETAGRLLASALEAILEEELFFADS